MEPPASLIGCCGRREAKSKYFERFGVVELQDTFDEPPSPGLARKWRELAPSSFQFCLKVRVIAFHVRNRSDPCGRIREISRSFFPQLERQSFLARRFGPGFV
jgi:uncharacterized protein YecE (DUF72 family)